MFSNIRNGISVLSYHSSHNHRETSEPECNSAVLFVRALLEASEKEYGERYYIHLYSVYIFDCDLYGVPCAGISSPPKCSSHLFFPPPISAEKTSQLLLPVKIETSNKHTQKRIGHKMLFDASDATDDALTAPFRTVPDSGLKLLNPGSVGFGAWRHNFSQQTQGGRDI